MKTSNLFKSLLAAALIAALAACGGGGGGNGPTTPPTTQTPVAPVTPNAAITLSLDQTKVALGKSATLTWSTTNATSCTASGAWSGVQLTAGSAVETPTAAGDQTFTLSCFGASGVTTTQTVTLSSVTFAAKSYDTCDLTNGPAPIWSVGDYALSINPWGIGSLTGVTECIHGPSVGTVVGTTPTQTGITAHWNWNWPDGPNYVKAATGVLYQPKGVIGNGWTGQAFDPIKVSDIN